MQITTAPTNYDLYEMYKQQSNEIEDLKQENNELKKDIKNLSIEIDMLKSSLERQLNIFL